MSHHPLTSQSVCSSILCVSFHSKMQKQYSRVHWQKIAQQGWKIAQTCLRRLRVFQTMAQTNPMGCRQPQTWLVTCLEMWHIRMKDAHPENIRWNSNWTSLSWHSNKVRSTLVWSHIVRDSRTCLKLFTFQSCSVSIYPCKRITKNLKSKLQYYIWGVEETF